MNKNKRIVVAGSAAVLVALTVITAAFARPTAHHSAEASGLCKHGRHRVCGPLSGGAAFLGDDQHNWMKLFISYWNSGKSIPGVPATMKRVKLVDAVDGDSGLDSAEGRHGGGADRRQLEGARARRLRRLEREPGRHAGADPRRRPCRLRLGNAGRADRRQVPQAGVLLPRRPEQQRAGFSGRVVHAFEARSQERQQDDGRRRRRGVRDRHRERGAGEVEGRRRLGRP